MGEEARVLVVDDEPAIRGLVAKIVERAGLIADTAADGEEAIAMIDRHTYDVIVVDLMMPRVDGYAVIEHVRGVPSPRPALIVASAADPPQLRKLDGSIVHSIVRKPFEIDVVGDLVAAAAEMVRRARAKTPSVLRFPHSQS